MDTDKNMNPLLESGLAAASKAAGSRIPATDSGSPPASPIRWWMPATVLLIVWAALLIRTIWGPVPAWDPMTRWLVAAVLHFPYLVILGFLFFGLIERIGYFWKGRAAEIPGRLPDELPVVCIQLPMFNEHAVADRVIKAASAIRWPRDRFILQVLDDSTDAETRDLVGRICEEVRTGGVNCMLLQRTDRKGYKAGALEVGRKQVNAEFFAIFDSDFLPPPDYLMRAMPYFFGVDGEPDGNLALVQAQWGHLNDHESFLTRAQALWVDDHHTLQKSWRSAAVGFVNFTGTAGIWRGSAVEAVGGWRSTSLVEDCELSFRILFGGYRTRFVKEIVVPAELPATYASYRLQQRRWTQGWVQLQRLHFRNLWLGYRSHPLRKVYLTYHMCISWQWPAWALWMVMFPFLIAGGCWFGEAGVAAGFFAYVFPPLGFVLLAGLLATLETRRKYAGRDGVGGGIDGRRLARIIPYMVINAGMLPHHLIAFLEGLFGPMHGEFERTPKVATVIAGTAGTAPATAPPRSRPGGLQVRGPYVTAEGAFIVTQLVWVFVFLAEGLIAAALLAGWLAACIAAITVASYLPNFLPLPATRPTPPLDS